MKKLLIAIDNGPTSENIARQGLQLGQQLNAEIALISVVDTEFLLTQGGVSPKEVINSIKKDYTEKQNILADTIFKNKKVFTFVEAGKPYEIILKTAHEWNADILVLGTHGRTGISHLLMGSVAEKVLRHSTIPLFIIPTK